MEGISYSKPKTTFYRRLYVAYLIDMGIDTTPLLMDKTGMPKRTVQDVISSLAEMDIKCEFQGAKKNGFYVITDWAAIKKEWIAKNLINIVDVLDMQC
jgi:hypothetical protein